MSRKLMKFLILFDNSNLLFFPGQFLSGRVILEVDDDMPVLGKSIIFSLLLLFACYLFGMGLHYETCLNDLYIRVRLFYSFLLWETKWYITTSFHTHLLELTLRIWIKRTCNSSVFVNCVCTFWKNVNYSLSG